MPEEKTEIKEEEKAAVEGKEIKPEKKEEKADKLNESGLTSRFV